MAAEQAHCSEATAENCAKETEVSYCHLNGDGVSINIDKAKAYFQEAPALGVREPSVELARLNKPYESP